MLNRWRSISIAPLFTGLLRDDSRNLAKEWLICFLLLTVVSCPARAASSPFEVYGRTEGLTDLSGDCLLQAPGNYMLACSQQGVFSFDGRRFAGLGPAQGLRQGGIIDNVTVTADKRVVVAYSDAVYVSDAAPAADRPPSFLHFSRVGLSNPVYLNNRHQIVSWRKGFAIIERHEVFYVPTGLTTSYRDLPIYQQSIQQPSRARVEGIFSVRGQLWEAMSDRTVCHADPDAAKCYRLSGNDNSNVIDMNAGEGTTIFLRRQASVVALEQADGVSKSLTLPDQGGHYINYPDELFLLRSPDGRLMTQCSSGLAILTHDRWEVMSVADGAPRGIILSAATDKAGEMWFQVQGVGILRSIGYGDWETIRHADGISDGIAWMTVRPSGGAVWLSTDTGIDEIVRRNSYLQVGSRVAGGSYALAVAPTGSIWSSRGKNGLKIFDPHQESVVEVDGPNVDYIAADSNGTMWVATVIGLFHFDKDSVKSFPRPITFPSQPLEAPGVISVASISDGTGGAWYISQTALRHRHADGGDRPLRGNLPSADFDAVEMALAKDGSLWLGGSGGLMRLALKGDEVISLNDETLGYGRAPLVTAVMIDHRGWVWAGTSLGISVFDGSRWVSADSSVGLLDDDVSQNGIREDPDGTIWVATAQGLSHLLHPASLFSYHSINAVISDATLGARHVRDTSLPFTTDPLTLQFGTTSYAAEHAILFRYRLDGVDAAWAETATGAVRYPFVPPGKHLLTVVAVDPLTHTVSTPAHLVIRMDFPWWRQWWAELLWFALAVSTLYVLLRLRVRALTARQRELQRRIDAATEEIRAAEVELRYRATHDGITGLLNRSEVERRLAEELAAVPRRRGLMVALADLDHFKRINDTLGHLAGDATLRSLGGLVEGILHPGDYAGRYGGEEVLIVLDDTDREAIARISELHAAIRGIRPGPSGTDAGITCSFGVAWERAGDSWETLIGRADAALYEAKQAGRDRIAESRVGRREIAAK